MTKVTFECNTHGVQIANNILIRESKGNEYTTRYILKCGCVFTTTILAKPVVIETSFPIKI